MTTPAASEPSILADGFLGIAFRRLRDGLLPHMRAVLGDDYQTGIGAQRTRRTVRLTDTADLYDLLLVWRDRRQDFIGGFTPGQREFAPGRNWPETINEFRSGRWARQASYNDDEVGRILDTIAAMLTAIGAVPQAEAVEHLASEFEAYLYQRSQLNPPDAPGHGNGTGLSPAEVAAGQAITARPGEPDVFAEGFLTRAWRRLGQGLGPYMERITRRPLDNPRDVNAILAGNLNQVDLSIYRECSTLLEARNKWAHQGRYQYRNVRLTLSEISQVLQTISENGLAQEVARMRDDLSRIHIAARRPDASAPSDDHGVITAIQFRPEQLITGFASVIPTSLATPEFHSALSALAGEPTAPTVMFLATAAPPRPSASDGGTIVSLADTAEDYYRRGEWQSAIDACNAAIARNPNDAAAYLLRGRAYGQLGDMAAAAVDFNAAAQLNPDIRRNLAQANSFYNRGVAAYERGEFDRAIANYTRAIEFNPHFAEAYSNRGSAYGYKGDQDLAIADYTAAIDINPQDATGYYNRGNAYYHKGDLDQAIIDYDVAIGIDPQLTTAYGNRGNAYAGKGEYDWAISDYDAVLRINPQDAMAHHNRGNTYYHKGEYDLAIADYDVAIGINPQLAGAYNSRGVAYAHKREYDLAIADYDAAIGINPQYGNAYYNRGVTYAEQGDYVRAIADYNTAISINPEDADPYYSRGVAYAEQGEYDRAITDFDTAIELATDDRVLQWSRDAGAQAIRLRDELNEYDQAIADNPDDPDAWHLRGLYYRDDREDYDRAIADFTQALSLTTAGAEILCDRARTHQLLGSTDLAMADYGEAIARRPDYAEAYYELGIIRTRRRQYQAAIADFDQAIAHRTGYALAYQRRGICYYRLDERELAQADFIMARELGLNP